MSFGSDMIVKERQRQIEVEKWSNDDTYINGELIGAAIAYLITTPEDDYAGSRIWWPWDEVYFKPSPHDRLKELMKAGALIAAEIDRITSV